MDSTLRKYLRNRVISMRKKMRIAKENGSLYYVKINGMLVKQELYHYHRLTLMEYVTVHYDKYFNYAMASIFLRFLRKETNVHITPRMKNILWGIYENPYYLANAVLCDSTESEVMSMWKRRFVELLEAENVRMRKGNTLERLLGMGRHIVKPVIKA